MITIKKNYILILITILFFTLTKSSETLLVNSTKSIAQVDSCFDLRNKDFVTKIPVSLGCNNKLFVCYSGYQFVTWNCDAGYAVNPQITGTTNILTEIDLCTKKEYVFDQPADLSDIMNNPQCQHASPVNDIARGKDNYYVAHGTSVYMYRSSNPWFTSPKLSKIKQLTGNLGNNDIIKKIFIDKDDNILAVSSYGIILKNSSANSVSMPIIAQSFPANQILYSCDYNSENNMILLGGNNFAQIVLLNNPIKTFTLAMDQLRIHTIDTNDNYILLSDVVPHTNRRDIHAHKGHLKAENCCRENLTPYEKWSSCSQCTKIEQEDRKNSLSLLRYYVPNQTCSHKICPYSEDNLIKSCKQNSILLLSLSKVMEFLNEKTNGAHINLQNSNLIEHRIDHKDKSYSKSEDISRISHVSLTKNFLIIAKSELNSSHFYGDIYNTHPAKIKSMQSSQKRHTGYDIIPDGCGMSSLEWNILSGETGDVIQTCKNIESGEKICLVNINALFKPEDTFQYVANANLFTHPNDQITGNLTESLKRLSRNFIQSCMREYKIILYDRRIQFAIAGMIACGIGIIKCLIELEKNWPVV